MRWRVGRSVGRTLYAQAGSAPGPADVLIGCLDTPELARAAAGAHNALLDRVAQARDQVDLTP